MIKRTETLGHDHRAMCWGKRAKLGFSLKVNGVCASLKQVFTHSCCFFLLPIRQKAEILPQTGQKGAGLEGPGGNKHV